MASPADEIDRRVGAAAQAWTAGIPARARRPRRFGGRASLTRSSARFFVFGAIFLAGIVGWWAAAHHAPKSPADMVNGISTLFGFTVDGAGDPLAAMAPGTQMTGLSPELVAAVEQRGGVVRAPSIPGFFPWQFELACAADDGNSFASAKACVITFVLRRDIDGRQDIIRLCSRNGSESVGGSGEDRSGHERAVCRADDRLEPRTMPDASQLVVSEMDSSIDPALFAQATTSGDLEAWRDISGSAL